MSDPSPCQFRWYELQTTDAAAAKAFYRAVVGWSAQHLGPQPEGYTTFNTAAGGVAGMMTLGEGEGPAQWVGYIAVDDVDAYADRVTAAGGSIRQPPFDVPGMLRFCGVADPQGAPFVVFKGTSPEGPPRGGPGQPGYIGWHELMANDGSKAFDFYSGLFGWTQTGAFGPAGDYLLWSDGRGADAGATTTRPEGARGPAWNFYFQVDGIAAAVERVKAAGGAVAVGPFQVPTGGWILQGIDPQGASFCLLSDKA
ncbi:MAG TPA: VOC family protein [Caulobacteraceae bacterium]|nr:VOC family protein [Caulobacteraceae bacterium]